jgi:hypothetical protein
MSALAPAGGSRGVGEWAIERLSVRPPDQPTTQPPFPGEHRERKAPLANFTPKVDARHQPIGGLGADRQ